MSLTPDPNFSFADTPREERALPVSFFSSSTSPIKIPSCGTGLEVPPPKSAVAQHKDMLSDMANLWVGPMPVEQFLKDFLPVATKTCPKLSSDYFDKMPKVTKEADMYDPLIHLLHNKAKRSLIPNFKMVNTSNHSDKHSAPGKKFKPDPTLYCRNVDTSENVTQFSEVELHFELKPDHSSDPFEDPDSRTTPDERAAYKGFETQSSERRKTCRGQLASYAKEWFSRQHRLFGFTIFLGDPWVRFIRWDRGGAIVSEKFNYREESHHLVEFLWRFTHATAAERGHDPTVRRATPAEIKLAEEHLSDWAPEHKRPVVVMSIMDGQTKREFIAWGAKSHSGSLTGRCTRAYPVYEDASNRKFFLKDTWRAFNLSKEAEILRTLQDNSVEHIPHFVCGDDILNQVTATDLYVPEVIIPKNSPGTDGAQSSVSGEEISVTAATEEVPITSSDSGRVHNADVSQNVPTDSLDPASTSPAAPPTPRPDSSWRCGNFWRRITQRFHHRFIVDFFGTPLEKFTSSKQMLQAVADAFTAHQQAYEKCGIIHRDISMGNIMLDANGRGILNDWDLAKHEDDIKNGGRLHERTGTWEFMSSQIAQNPAKIHTIQDDIESFVLVVLYVGLRYIDHNLNDFTLCNIIKNVFEHKDFGKDGRKRGGHAKESMFRNRAHLEADFAFMKVDPLTEWTSNAIFAVAEYLDYIQPLSRKSKWLAKDAPKLGTNEWLSTHATIAKFFDIALEMPGWPTDDKAVDAFLSLDLEIDVEPTPEKVSSVQASSGHQTASSTGSKRGRESQSDDEEMMVFISHQPTSSTGSKRGRESQNDNEEAMVSTGSRKRGRKELPPAAPPTRILPSRTTRSTNRHAPAASTPLRESTTDD